MNGAARLALDADLPALLVPPGMMTKQNMDSQATLVPPPPDAAGIVRKESSLARKWIFLLGKKETQQIPKPDVKGPAIEINEHRQDLVSVAEKFQTRLDVQRPQKSLGLTKEQASELLKTNGHNAITPSPKKPMWLQFLMHFLNPFNVMLIVSGFLSLVLYAIDHSQTLILALVLFFVGTMNSSIEFYQEFKSNEILSSFMSLVPPMCLAIRDGHPAETLASELVVGDVLAVKSGDKIPADMRLIHTVDFKVDNSSITGESEPQERSTAACLGPPLEASNLALSGTMAVSGEAQGIVIRTGDHSVLGQIAKLTCSSKDRPSQMSQEISVFVKKIALIAFTTALFFFVYGLIRAYDIGMTFSFAIGLFVAFVPQGIPATVTLLLTIAAKRLSRKNVLVKDLQGVETLGAITLLATDKTGTLTQNRMSVFGAWINGRIYSATGIAESASEQLLEPDTPNLQKLIDACALCTKSRFDPADMGKPIEERNIFGDATEAGLLRFAANFTDATQYMEDHPKVFEIPFNSASKWHLAVNSLPHEKGPLTMFIKGAPERVAALCKFIQVDDKILPWTEDTTSQFNQAYESFASRGQRVLAFGFKHLEEGEYPADYQFTRDPRNFPENEFTFAGLISLMDPPKRGVRKAVAACRTAGIQVVMVTGDHPLTAEAIARKIGLIQGDTATDAAIKNKVPFQMVREDQYDAIVIHGDRIDSFTDSDWDRALSKREIVFARTSPKHKLEIVTRFQNKGHIVGVSGDGVNDSPALKKADLGISMNKTASDVSKEAASMILLDDNFASIITGIMEGRLIFANLKKSIRYTLTHLTPEITAYLTFIILSIPVPLSPILTLMIDLGTELGPAISYAFEEPEGDLMLVPPRKVLTSGKSADAAAKKKPGRMEQLMIKMRLRRPKPERPVEDPEVAAQEPVPVLESLDPRLSWHKRVWLKIRQGLSAGEFTGETLIDSDMCLWSFFQGGVIEGIGCFSAYLIVLAWERVPMDSLYGASLTYFQEGAPPLTLTNGLVADAQQQLQILAMAQGAFFAAIVVQQWFNLFVTKHRYSYPYGRDMLRNKWTWLGVAVGAAIASIIIYVPFVNSSIFDTAPFTAVAFAAPVAMGIFLFGYEFGRRFLRKKGYFGGVPTCSINLVELVRTTTSAK